MKSSKSKSRTTTALSSAPPSGYDMDDSTNGYSTNGYSTGATAVPRNPNGLTEMPSTTSPDVLVAQSKAIKKAKGGGQSSTILTKSQNKPGQARTPLSPDMLRIWK